MGERRVLCALSGVVVVLWILLEGVSCAWNRKAHVDEGSPGLLFVLGGTRLSGIRCHRAAAAPDEEESRGTQSSPS